MMKSHSGMRANFNFKNILLGFCVILMLAVTPNNAFADHCVDDIDELVEKGSTFNTFGNEWNKSIFIAEFNVSDQPIKHSCPQGGTYLKADSQNVFFRQPGEFIYFWFRLVGTSEYFDPNAKVFRNKKHSLKVIYTDDPDAKPYGIKYGKKDSVTGKYRTFIRNYTQKDERDRAGVKTEFDWKTAREKLNRINRNGVNKKELFFDWRSGFNTENISNREIKIILYVDGASVDCDDQLMSACDCSGSECGIKITLEDI